MINDEECQVGLPSPVDDQSLLASGSRNRATEAQFSNPLLPTIGVIRGISQLLEALKTTTLAPSVLQTFDSLFGDCVAAFPTQHHLRSDGYLEPYCLPPLLYLQNARLMLHRHNLMSTFPLEARSAAIHHCVIVAQDTTRLLSRSMRDPPDASQQLPYRHEQWTIRLALAASASICTHIWRCTLFLCFRGIYDAALLCARASAAIADARPVNTSCGKYLERFLTQLTSKAQRGENLDFDGDENMIAYVSADLQGSIEKSWVWQGVESHVRLSERLKRSESGGPFTAGQEIYEDTVREEEGVWVGWGRILDLLDRLLQKQQREQQYVMTEDPTTPTQRGPLQAASSRNTSSPQDPPAASNRISIANII